MAQHELIVLVLLFGGFVLVARPYLPTVLFRGMRYVVAAVALFALARFFFAEARSGNAFVSFVWLASLLLVAGTMLNSELRALSLKIASQTGMKFDKTIEDDAKHELLYGVDYLSRHKIGALITFERSDSLDAYIEHAFKVDAALSRELLSSIFVPYTPLHDGAVIIRENVIKCAGAYFPPSEKADIPKYYGSRHRAAIGISEVTDSLTVLVSEETGEISIAIEGYLDKDISRESLMLYLEKYLQN